MKKPLFILGAMVLLQAAPSVESAGTVTGTLGATLTIITGVLYQRRDERWWDNQFRHHKLRYRLDLKYPNQTGVQQHS